jgi:SpoVK/Ycf46/Vps4 family AAA+-type ATPase
MLDFEKQLKNQLEGSNLGGFSIKEPHVSNEELYRSPEIERKSRDLIDLIENPEVYGTEMGRTLVIASGPPGNGKTRWAEWLATTTESTFIDARSVMVPQQIDELFKTAREEAKKNSVVVLLDEIDKYGKRDDIVPTGDKATLNHLLQQIEGTESNYGVMVVAPTNLKKHLDTALLSRASEIKFLPYDEQGRYEIIKIHAIGYHEDNIKSENKKGHKFRFKEKDLKKLAQKTYGYAGRDLKMVLEAAFAHARRDDGRLDIQFQDLEYALSQIKPSVLRNMPYKIPKKIFRDDLEERMKDDSKAEELKKMQVIDGVDTYKNFIIRRITSAMQQGKGMNFLLYGPSGTGKSVLLEAIANRLGINFIEVKASELEGGIVGETQRNLAEVIENAEYSQPCILAFEEFNTFIERRYEISHKNTQTGTVLTHFNEPLDGVYTFAIMNQADDLADNVLRRFPLRLYMGLPESKEAYKAIWQAHIDTTDTGFKDFDMDALVESSEGLTPSDIRDVCLLNDDPDFKYEPDFYMADLRQKQTEAKGRNYSAFEAMKIKVGDAISTYKRKMMSVKTAGSSGGEK